VTISRTSCLVIGGGLAGLSAAYQLTSAGWKVDVLEAQDRLGGRVLSHEFKDGPGLICELGAEWIGDDHTLMLDLVDHFGLEKQSHRYAMTFWNGEYGGSRVYRPDAWCFSKPLRRRFNTFARQFSRLSDEAKRKLDLIDWWTRLQQDDIGFSPRELARRDLMDSTDFGESIRMTSAYSAAAEYCEEDPKKKRKSRTDQMDWKIEGGNEKLIRKLENAIGTNGTIRKRAEVVTITQRNGRVAVRTKRRDDMYVATYCICTVPTHALLDIEWHPALPPKQRTAARQLQYSRILKTAVLYTHQFWKTPRSGGFAAFTNRASDFCFESTYGQEGKKRILCSYAIGDKADDLAQEVNENNVMRWITEDVAAVSQPRAKVRIAPIDIKMQAWHKEKWIHRTARAGENTRPRPFRRRASVRRVAGFHGRRRRNDAGFGPAARQPGAAF
jgi:monoamine oxidase